MSPWFLFVALSATPTSGVALSKTMSAERQDALALVELVRQALDVTAAVGPEDATSCAAKAACLAQLAVDKHWEAVVSVETASVLDEVLVSIRAYAAGEPKVLAQARVQAPRAGLPAALRQALAPVSKAVSELHARAAAALAAKEAEAAEQAKREAALLAKRRAEAARPPAWEPIARWLPVSLAALVAVGGGVSLALSEAQAQPLRARTLATPEAVQAAAQTGRTLQTLGVVGLAAGGTLFAATLVFALTWKGAAPAVVLTPHAQGGVVSLVGSWP